MHSCEVWTKEKCLREVGEARDREETTSQVNEMCRLLLVFRVDVRVNGNGSTQRRSVYSSVEAEGVYERVSSLRSKALSMS